MIQSKKRFIPFNDHVQTNNVDSYHESSLYLIGISTNNSYLTAFGLCILATQARTLGNYHLALIYFDEAADLYRSIGGTRFYYCISEILAIPYESKIKLKYQKLIETMSNSSYRKESALYRILNQDN